MQDCKVVGLGHACTRADSCYTEACFGKQLKSVASLYVSILFTMACRILFSIASFLPGVCAQAAPCKFQSS